MNITREENIVKNVLAVLFANMENSGAYATIVKVMGYANMKEQRLTAKSAGVVKFANMEKENPTVKIVMELKFAPTVNINTHVVNVKEIFVLMVNSSIYVQIVTVRKFANLDLNHIIQVVGLMVIGN